MNIVSLQEFSRKKSFEECANGIREIYNDMGLVTDDFYDLISQDINDAVRKIPEFIEKARNAGMPGGMVYESLTGGPNPDFIVPLINGVGRVYPELSEETREIFAKHILDYLDSLRCDYSRNHVEDIEEPWLVRDILLDRSIYFPGYENYAKFLEKFRTWNDFNKGLGSEEGRVIKSPFWLTMAVIHPKYSSLEVRKNYYERFDSLVDRTLDSTAALNFEWSKKYVERNRLKYEEELKDGADTGPLFEWEIQQSKCEGSDFEEELEDRIKNIDPLLHDKLRRKIDERNWKVIH